MTQEDIEEYMASGRLEPNLHIFTNPLYPPYGSDLEHAQQASWLAFLAAKDSNDPAVWNATDAAGDNLLRAYAEADTSDDDEACTCLVAVWCLISISKWRNQKVSNGGLSLGSGRLLIWRYLCRGQDVH